MRDDDYTSPDTLDRYRRVLRAYAIRKGLASEADDISQEALARMLERRDVLDLKRDPFSWLMKVTVRLCSDARRARARVQVADDQEMEAHTPGAGLAPSALDVLLAHDHSETIAMAVRRLSPADRSIIYQRAVLGLSYEAIAADEDVSVNTLRTRLCRAKDRLQTNIEELRAGAALVLLKLRARRAGTPMELPGLAATTLAQAAMPLAVLASLAAGGSMAVPTRMTTSHVAASMSLPVDALRSTNASSPASGRAASEVRQATRPKRVRETAVLGDSDTVRVVEDGDGWKHWNDPGGDGHTRYTVEVFGTKVVEVDTGYENSEGDGLVCRLTCPHDR